MEISEAEARRILFGVYDAWNVRDVERLLSYYDDDLTFWANVGGPDGGALTIKGKALFRQAVQAWTSLDCISVPQNFHFERGVARVSVEFFVRDPKSGQNHASTYRHVAEFRNGRIMRAEQYHDAAALQAFLSLMSKD